ncbi:unnamed protein product [Eretmochelys imbricata]
MPVLHLELSISADRRARCTNIPTGVNHSDSLGLTFLGTAARLHHQASRLNPRTTGNQGPDYARLLHSCMRDQESFTSFTPQARTSHSCSPICFRIQGLLPPTAPGARANLKGIVEFLHPIATAMPLSHRSVEQLDAEADAQSGPKCYSLN